jgi:hypothetical protein
MTRSQHVEISRSRNHPLVKSTLMRSCYIVDYLPCSNSPHSGSLSQQRNLRRDVMCSSYLAILLNTLLGHVAMNTIHYKIGPVLNGQTNAQLKEVQVFRQSGPSHVHLSNSLLVMFVLDIQGRALSRCFGLDLDKQFGQALFQMLAVEVLIQHISRHYTVPNMASRLRL